MESSVLEPERPKEPLAKRIVRYSMIFDLVLVLYAGSYFFYRRSHKEVWEKDGKAYVIFPKDDRSIYYFFRPASLLDAHLTGIGVHLGPHE